MIGWKFLFTLLIGQITLINSCVAKGESTDETDGPTPIETVNAIYSRVKTWFKPVGEFAKERFTNRTIDDIVDETGEASVSAFDSIVNSDTFQVVKDNTWTPLKDFVKSAYNNVRGSTPSQLVNRTRAWISETDEQIAKWINNTETSSVGE